MEIKKEIGFATELVPLVKNHTKVLTYRLGNKYDFLKVGDVVDTYDSVTGEVFGRLRITKKEKTIFKELPIDRIGHEVYPSKDGQRRVFEKFYGEIKDEDLFIILGFELL